MKIVSLLIGILATTLLACSSSAKKQPSQETPAITASPGTTGYVTNAQQVTFAGKRAGEAYFSQDGRYMVFQSEREPGNPFYQIYLMDTQTGTTRRLSTGQGKTTCAWIHPSNKFVLFSSSHEDPDFKKKVQAELEERKNPKHRYSWSFDDTYDIYRTDVNGKGMINLTKAKGYDAEGSYSPDGQWIAFASNRAAYTGKMTPEERAGFEKDPSYMMDLYIMKADGSQVRQITKTPGYDGGPFFSPDGKRLTFRRFNSDGRTADIYTINVDGTDEKRLTNFQSLSWAPFYHPSGDYLIFASNKFGHANFELFIIDREGRNPPMRVTDLEGFDGLPVFTPDGTHLVWAHTNDKGETQVYRADWNDSLARTTLKLNPAAPLPLTLQPAITAADAKNWVNYLAHPYFEGRMTGGKKENEYVTALADAFKSMGLKPVNGSYIQKYEFTNGIELGPNNRLEVKNTEEALSAKINEDWVPLSYSKSGQFPAGEIFFAGYGIVAPAVSGQEAYDSFGDADVRGKWVMAFAGLPENVTQERRFHLHLYSRLQHKAMVARQKGALGLIVIDDLNTPGGALAVKFEGRSDDAGLPVIRLSNKLADRLLTNSGNDRKGWTTKLAEGAVFNAPIGKFKLNAEVDLRLIKSIAHNVVAMLPAPNAKSSVVIGAHLDHLGWGESGNSLSAKPGIHPGADDNASGVAGVMEIAHHMKQALSQGQLQLQQNVIFGLWTGEEIGTFGSAHFVNTYKSPILAYLNLDMIGRYRDNLLIQSVGSAKEWASLIEKTAATENIVAKTQEDPYVPSDALTFYLKTIPSLSFFTGSHSEYHTTEDKPQFINYEGLVSVANFVDRIGELLAGPEKPKLTYEKVEGQSKGGGGSGRGFRLYLGTIPDYTREGVQGVAISGTSKNSPAEKAGLVAGDVIVELGGMTIKNINDYVYCLQALKANEKTKLRVLRAGAERELEITPVLKTQQ